MNKIVGDFKKARTEGGGGSEGFAPALKRWYSVATGGQQSAMGGIPDENKTTGPF